ncbi:MAG: OmpA family protein [Comamonadaceae bacterium]|nr:MAG: OmpA family protein [Comamonadaceae bacterium]
MQISQSKSAPSGFFTGLWLSALMCVALAGCATRAPSTTPIPLDQAIATATDTVMAPGLVDRFAKRSVVLDPTLDAATGQQTLATQKLDAGIAARIASQFPQVELLPFQAANLAKAQYLMTGTLARSGTAFEMNLSLVDIKTGTVSAQSSAMVRGDSVDMSPLAYYRDSPILVKDKVIDGYVRTASTPAGQRADAPYLERIATATTINDANLLYNSARYREALGQYRSALASPSGDQIRVLTGIYLTTQKLGQTAEAEEAFGRLVAYGIASKQLGMKFLFSPGTTDFWPDPKVSSAYTMWLRQIARQAASAKVCMDIVGHSSKTGTEDVNDSLSLRRASTIRQRLIGDSSVLGSRTKPLGVGSRETIVGSGTDDVVDTLDRRVEFKIVDCTR